jgi:F420-dependent oxidoreductase-like protein
MKIGLQIVRFNWPGTPANTGEVLAKIAGTADEAGFSSLWVMDHYYQIAPGLGEEDDPMLEGYSVLNYLAGFTEKLRLGTLVSGVFYRQPAYLVKTVTALDVLSGGRAYFGIGAGWYEAEAHGMGFPFPPLRERFERLEEALQIAHLLWEDDRSPFEGRHYRLEKPINSPQPLSQPRPPILIGGMGEKKTLRFVAKYADACNLFTRYGDDVLKQKIQVLRRHCDNEGRDFDDLEVTTLTTVHLTEGEDTPAQVIQSCEKWAEMGVDHAIFNMPNVHDVEPLETFGEAIIPAVADL